MQQAKLTAPETLTYEEVDKPSPAPEEVVIKVKVCGICGSDIHSYQGKHPFVHPPIVLGHEFSGVVEEVGTNVEDFDSGDKVTVEPNLPCGHCYNCNHGDYNICKDLEVVGNVGYDGAFAEFISIPADRVVPIPEEMTFEQAALIEPAAVGVHAVRISEQETGDNVVVLGAGTIGLLTVGSAVASGAKDVIATDLSTERLELAKELGADLAHNPGNEEDSLDQVIQKQFGPAGADMVYDCVGVESTVNQAISVARKGSQIMLVGVPKGNLSVNLAYVQDRELDIKGSLMYVRKDFLEAIELIKSEELQVTKLITHRFPFEDLEEAFQLAIDENQVDEKLKILVRF